MHFCRQNELDKLTAIACFRKFFIALALKQVHLASRSLNLTFAAQETVDFLNKNREN
jgi:hypothetical protein